MSTSLFQNNHYHKVKGKGKVKSLSHVRLFATPWTITYQAPLSMGFSRQEYWSRLPFPSPGDPSNPGIEPRSPALQADTLLSEPPGKPTTKYTNKQENKTQTIKPNLILREKTKTETGV